MQLNILARTDAQWTIFDGVQRGCWYALQSGVYYGEMQGGKRHGYGLLYCTDTNGNPFLYECQWMNGLPIIGRYIVIRNGEWIKQEGTFDPIFVLTG